MEGTQGPSHHPHQGQPTASQEPARQDVNVFDYEVSSFDDEKSTPAQEMQEKSGQRLLSQSNTNTGNSSSAMDTDWDEIDDSSKADEHDKPAEA